MSSTRIRASSSAFPEQRGTEPDGRPPSRMPGTFVPASEGPPQRSPATRRPRLAPRAQYSHIARGKHPRDRVDVSEEANAPSELEIERERFHLILGPRRAAREQEHRRELADLVENDPPRMKQRRVILARV